MLGIKHAENASNEEPSRIGQQSGVSVISETATKLLHKRLRVTVLDGRVLVGEFICLDKQGNIILHHAAERVEIDGQAEEKFLGQILVPAKQRVKCEVELLEEEVARFAQHLPGTLTHVSQ